MTVLCVLENVPSLLERSQREYVTKYETATFIDGILNTVGATHQYQNSIDENFILNSSFKKIKLGGICLIAHPSSLTHSQGVAIVK